MIEIPPINARTLLLDLVLTNEPPVYTARQFLSGGEALGIAAPAIRTALSRLAAEGRVENMERGLYGIGPKGRPLRKTLLAWREHQAPPRDWNGRWMVAVASPADRADRTVWRHTLRALKWCGLAEAETGVWCRPDNLKDAGGSLRATLEDVGGSSSLLILQSAVLDEDRERNWRTLWGVEAMLGQYRDMADMLEESAARLQAMPLPEAAAEALLYGREAIRMLLLDPNLPEELCPSAPRRRLATVMARYDRLGKKIWHRLLEVD